MVGIKSLHKHKALPSFNKTNASAQSVSILGLPVIRLTYAQVLQHLKHQIRQKEKVFCVALNLDVLRLAYYDLELWKAIHSADLIFADGMPIIWLSWLQRNPLQERIAGCDLVYDLCRDSGKELYNIFFLGAAPGVAEMARHRLMQNYPQSRIVGTYSPTAAELEDEAASQAIIEQIHAQNTDILFVALGAPKQELWIAKHRDRLNVSLVFPCGGSIDFIAGVQRKAPSWVGGIGLEWCYRLLSNPRKFYRRYLIQDIPFSLNILVSHVLNMATIPFSETVKLIW